MKSRGLNESWTAARFEMESSRLVERDLGENDNEPGFERRRRKTEDGAMKMSLADHLEKGMRIPRVHPDWMEVSRSIV